ncbi:7-carboxy-7-deazaguanine synthase QueE [Amantichitinum ursilacus]|uniref:7-carboxy-7-deazaguanine synthase n=1 Tax=Amantichitinum ursilacus TaxID=857265 RepID=A0A0N0GN47_9NEIS|nr:7-carboxy-7-deazaguanine synthase QueE [Amantichitinum ursilacus]KPC52120.1 7-carboxy-7-deazaguanine synthase [Amantichitinum ursilacus]
MTTIMTQTPLPPSVRITEIFFSLQGETSRMGLPTVFVRLTGCPLRCGYCDSAYAFHGGQTLSFDAILEQVASYGARTVCVTGGEPLAQKHSLALLRALCDAGYDVSLETSGALAIDDVDARVSRIVDIKTPGSGELDKMRWENLDVIKPGDEIKFVLVDRADYEWARDLLQTRQLAAKAPVLFSPVWETLKPTDLADWVIQDKLPVRMQVQLHKILWGDRPGV